MHPHKAHSEPKISFLPLASERPEWSDGDHSVAGHQQIRNEIVSRSSLPVLQVKPTVLPRNEKMEGRPKHETAGGQEFAAGNQKNETRQSLRHKSYV